MDGNRNDRDYGRDNFRNEDSNRGSERGFGDSNRSGRETGNFRDNNNDRGYEDRGYGDRNHGQRGGFGGGNREEYGFRGAGGFSGDRQGGGGYDEWSRGSRPFGERAHGFGGDRDNYSSRGAAGDYGSRNFGGNLGNRGYGESYGSTFGAGEGNRGDYGYGNQAGGSRWSGGGQSYGGSERGYSEEGRRGFWDKASDEVSSWFGDRDAERRREADQHRGRGPKNYSRSDDRIRDDINDKLTDDGWLDASDVDVTVKDREVTLSGTVSDRNAKRRAEDVAEGVSGVSHVQNNLRVKSQSGTGNTFSGGLNTSDVSVDRSTISTASTGLGSDTGATVAKSGAGGQR